MTSNNSSKNKYFNGNEDEYIEKRFEDQRKYYDTKALIYQKKWKYLSVLIVVLSPIPLVVLSFVSLPLFAKLVVVAASYLITILSSIITLLKYRELWLSYRTTEQEMLREFFHYKTCTGSYRNIQDDMERFQLFVERIESLMGQERSKWLDYIQQQDLPK